MNQTARISIYFAVASALTVAASTDSWAADIGVGPQYDTTHVYVEPEKWIPSSTVF
ncbi:hypothetical protein BN1044_02850 [Hafnia alvei]|uniref:Uncharacterized protein n=1 Tax=Hafnia alvei TaxID=569 RepID=A0A1C6Z2C4_HAFAL|nr:hypothetical protein BN1044_02850 [Hafnia alvei]